VLRAIAGAGGSTTAVIRFDRSDPRAIAQVQVRLSGGGLATQGTPLREEPRAASRDAGTEPWVTPHGFEDVQPESIERRGAPRRSFGRSVQAIRWQGRSEPRALLAKDLSLTGLCLAATPALPIRSELWLALYGARARSR